MAIVEQKMLIFTDAINNNNKFYSAQLMDDNTVRVRWGRVGAEGQNQIKTGGKYEFDSVVHSKIAKGYEEAKVMDIQPDSKTNNQQALAEKAKLELAGTNPVLANLVDRLAVLNRHQLMTATAGNIKLDIDTGLITTPLGLVTLDTINDARGLLTRMESYVDRKQFASDSFIGFLNSYLKLIPQKVPHARGWHMDFFSGHSSLVKQNDLLDQLEGSLTLYKQKAAEIHKKMAEKDKDAVALAARLFDIELHIEEDKKVIAKLKKFYEDTKNNRHVSQNMQLDKVYRLHHPGMTEKFQKVEKKMGNTKMLWHGTRAFNVLSILKNGLIIPKGGGSFHITGRMFGDGVYFSDQSTKSLNYSVGYWDGGPKDNTCFMFIADVAMGKEYSPSGGRGGPYPQKGYDSTFAKAGSSGVMNNETIVYSLDQVNLRYLCEFKA